jgi:hypothetical protein
MDRIELARAYVQAHDELAGEKHQGDLAALRRLDDERLALVTRIGEREAAYVAAQAALFAHDVEHTLSAEAEPTPESVLDAETEISEIFDAVEQSQPA